MNAERFIKQKEITWDNPFSNWNRTAFKKALNEFAEIQKEAINYTRCCKSDSELFSFADMRSAYEFSSSDESRYNGMTFNEWMSKR